MRQSSLIGHAAEVLDRILHAREPADVLLQDFFRARKYLGARDRREISAMVFDVLRHHDLLAAIWRSAYPDLPPAPLPLLLVRALTIHHEGEAGVTEGFDALWRTFVRTSTLADAAAAVEAAHARFTPPAPAAERLALLYSIPAPVAADWTAHFGEADAEELCRASNTPAPTTLRVNTLRCTVPECRDALCAEGIDPVPTRLSPVGLTLPKRVNVAGLRSFRQGWFEIQDEGSQLLSLLVDPQPGMTVVDACAGGGGKTLHLAALMRNQGLILAMDVVADRLFNLRERASRAGASIALPHLASRGVVDSFKGTADAVLIDAPCSGTGTYRRNPGAKLRFTSETLAGLVRIQQRLLADYQRMVKPGGTLVYATCSLLRAENQDQVERFLGAHPDFVQVPADGPLKRQGVAAGATFASDALQAGGFPGALELLPHRTGTDGFFAAVLRRSA